MLPIGEDENLAHVFYAVMLVFLPAVFAYLYWRYCKKMRVDRSEREEELHSELSVLERVALVIYECFSIPVDDIKSETEISVICSLDPLGQDVALADLAIGLEDEFEIYIADGDIDLCKTIRDVVAYIEKRLQESNS